MKKYNIIYCDPPWTYRDKCLAGKRGAGFKYKLMSIEQIKELPVKNITADDCILFMWLTNPLIENLLPVMEAWGFKFKTKGFEWIKLNKNKPTPFWGMGNWTRSNSESCWIGVKGKPKRVSASVHSVIMSPIRKHSQKPNEARERIVKLCGDLPRIELFATDKTDGWDSWGYDVTGDTGLLEYVEGIDD